MLHDVGVSMCNVCCARARLICLWMAYACNLNPDGKSITMIGYNDETILITPNTRSSVRWCVCLCLQPISVCVYSFEDDDEQFTGMFELHRFCQKQLNI